MGWAVGEDRNRKRHIGYGVPATCDQPGCGKGIDRGLSHACGGGVAGSVDNCGLFFCSDHLAFKLDDEWVCERCANDQVAFPPTPEVAEWVKHVLTDESWAEWRREEPEWADHMRELRPKGDPDARP